MPFKNRRQRVKPCLSLIHCAYMGFCEMFFYVIPVEQAFAEDLLFTRHYSFNGLILPYQSPVKQSCFYRLAEKDYEDLS